MSFSFGQIRGTGNTIFDSDTYCKEQSSSIQAISGEASGLTFTNSAISTSFSTNGYYYMRFKVRKRADGEQVIALKLIHSNYKNQVAQNVKTIIVEEGDSSETVTFECILSPKNICNQCLFELKRYSVVDYARTIAIENVFIGKLNNLLENKGEIYQIGVQAEPGFLMCINGEEIRVGKSGLYEINNGTKIKSFSAIPIENNNFFLLDYKYYVNSSEVGTISYIEGTDDVSSSTPGLISTVFGAPTTTGTCGCDEKIAEIKEDITEINDQLTWDAVE